MKYIYSTSQMSKLSLTLRTFSITSSVAGLFLTYVDLWNNLSFSLYTAPSVCHMVTTSDDRKKSKMRVSADLVCHYLNTRN